jgi:DNA-binding MarR family transcriptional regulator
MQKGSVTAGQLSSLTGLTTGAVTGLVDRLEKKELVKREYDETDRRKVLIVPNYDNANKLMGPLFVELQKRVVQLISSYTEVETEIIEKYLRESIQMLNGFSDEIKSAR